MALPITSVIPYQSKTPYIVKTRNTQLFLRLSFHPCPDPATDVNDPIRPAISPIGTTDRCKAFVPETETDPATGYSVDICPKGDVFFCVDISVGVKPSYA